jgi:hypothetical protein
MTGKLFIIIGIFQPSRDEDITKFHGISHDWVTGHCRLVGQGKEAVTIRLSMSDRFVSINGENRSNIKKKLRGISP